MNIRTQTFKYRGPVVVFSLLILLTIITVLTSKYFVLGDAGGLMLAMSLASMKGSLVLVFFMHLNHEPLIFKLFVGLALLTLATLFILTFADYAFRGVS